MSTTSSGLWSDIKGAFVMGLSMGTTAIVLGKSTLGLMAMWWLTYLTAIMISFQISSS